MIDRLLAYEDGTLTDEQTIALFQDLLTSGLVWHLQGNYTRTAQRLLDAGAITAPQKPPQAITVLTGHTSQKTAYRIADYPAGWRLRCQLRAWIETNPARGQRYVTQTSDAKAPRLTWHKPQYRPYARLWVMYLHTETGHLDAAALQDGDNDATIDRFVARYGVALTDAYSVVALKLLRAHARL
jgi:hypothetical protein